MFEYLTSSKLSHNGDCHILGISNDAVLFVEEIYGDDDFLARYAIDSNGDILRAVDEHDAQTAGFVPFTTPPDLVSTGSPVKTVALNFSGPRLRGQREPERVAATVRTLTMATKMELIRQFSLSLMPMQILGIAESYVLAEAALAPPDLYFVCRRLRLVYTLTEPKRDTGNHIYDYDSYTFYVAHSYNIADFDIEVEPETAFAGLPNVTMYRPMDCLVHKGRLWVADGGDDNRQSMIHCWRIVE